jgi:hypothetical protein
MFVSDAELTGLAKEWLDKHVPGWQTKAGLTNAPCFDSLMGLLLHVYDRGGQDGTHIAMDELKKIMASNE